MIRRIFQFFFACRRIGRLRAGTIDPNVNFASAAAAAAISCFIHCGRR